MKKLLSVVCILSLIFTSFFTFNVLGATTGKFTYDILPSGGISLKSYHGTGEEKILEIPETYDGRTVTAINFDELNDITYVEEVKIPKTVDTISSNAFCGSCFLQRIIVAEDNPNFSTKEGVLYNKDFTKLLCYPNTKQDEKFVVPSTVKTIGEKAFELSMPNTITLPEGLESIDSKAFWCSLFLEKINLPSTLKSIGDNAFCNCVKLDNVVIPEGVTEIKTKTFDSCTSLTNITLPNTLTILGEKAFMFCKSLKSITLPGSLNAIDGGNPFIGDTSLSDLKVDEDNPYFAVKNGSLYSKDMTKLYFYPYTKTEATVSLPSGIISIENSVFKDNNRITSMVVPSSVRFIGDSAFSNTSITYLNVPKGVERINEMCFSSCKSLKKVNFPSTLKSIGSSAFRDCPSLTDVYYGGSKITWGKIKVESLGNDSLLKSKFHYAIVPPTKISLPYTSTSLYRRASRYIGAKVSNGVGRTTYKSSNSRVATVSSTGKITAVSRGTATIAVTNNKVKRYIRVTVKNPTISRTSLILRKGRRYTLKITGRVGTARFSSSNRNIAYVNSKGVITGKRKGTAYIYVKTNGLTLKCKVSVR